MRLFYCAGSTIPSNSANSIHVMRMCEALAASGHDVVLFAKRGGEVDPFSHYGVERGFEIELIDFGNRLSLIEYLRRLRRFAKPDLALGRYLYPLLWLQARGVETLYESHAPPGFFRQMLERRLFRNKRFQGLIVITEALKTAYVELRILQPRNIRVLADAAVDPGAPAPLPRNLAADGSAPKVTIGFAGSWYAGRGVELMHELARRLPMCRFRLAGGTLENLAAFGLHKLDNIEYAGVLAPGRVAEFLRGCDVLLAPYQREISVLGGGPSTAEWCSPMKLFEYMAQGKAIVCSDLKVFHEVLEHDENCLMVDPEDIDGWVVAVELLVADGDLLNRLATKAREDFLARYTWEIRASQLVNCTNSDGAVDVGPG